MKKSHFYLLLGILFLVAGIYLYTTKKEPVRYYEEESLTREQAVSTMKTLIEDVILIYEKPEEFFETEKQENGTIKIVNYDNAIKKVFTENGIKEFENTKFNGVNYITKEEEVHINTTVPIDDKLYGSNMTFDKYSPTGTKVTFEVTFTSDMLDSNNEVTYKMMTKNITMLKVDSNWYIESFIYNNK